MSDSNGQRMRPLPWNRTAGAPQEFSNALAAYKDDIVNRYKGADLDRFSRDMVGVHPQGSSADRHHRQEIRFYRMMEIARDIDRNDMTASQGMDRLCVNVLQGGFKYDPATGNELVDRYLKDKWQDWSTDPEQVDLQGERDFEQLTWAIFRASLLDGDHLVNPLSSGQFQTIETHLLRTPYGRLSGDELHRTVHGVLLDDNRRRKRYYVSRDDIDPWETIRFQSSDYREIAAFDPSGEPNVFLIKHNFKRSGSLTRGVTIYAPIIHAIGLLDDVQFAKLVQQQSVSSWVAQILRQIEGEYPDEDRTVTSAEAANLCRPGEWREIDDVSAGMIYKGLPGEELRGFSPNVPNPTYIDHAKQIMEVIGTNLYMPYIVLMLDATATNFSGWRGAMDQAKLIWQFLQNNLSKDWHRQALRFKMRQWTTPESDHYDPFLGGMLQRGVDVFRHRWQFPAWPYVNPVEDVTANALEVQKLQNSPRRVQSRQGRDYEEVIVGELIDDNAALIRRAMTVTDEIRQEFPDQDISWEQLIAVPTPDNISISASKSLDDDASQEQTMVADIGQ